MATHGRGKGYVKKLGGKPTTLTPAVLPEPLPAVEAAVAAPVDRDEAGKIASSEAAKELGRRGGLARAEKRSVLAKLGLERLIDNAPLADHYKAAQVWFEDTLNSIALQSNGYVGPAPIGLLQVAAGAFAAARYGQEQLANSGSGAWLGMIKQNADLQRQNVLAATDMAINEAKSRKAAKENPAFHDIFADESGAG